MIEKDPRSVRLLSLAQKCDAGPSSRGLDVEIFRVLHNLSDATCQDRSKLIPGSNAGRVVLRGVGRWRLASYPTPRFTSHELRSEAAANGLVTVLEYQAVGDTPYFDAAGFPGRTVGLKAAATPQRAAR